MTRLEKLARSARLVLAALVATLTLSVTAHAIQMSGAFVFPNGAMINYNLAGGAVTPPFAVQVAGQGVFVMGVCTTNGEESVGHATLHRVGDSYLAWVGLESPSGSVITSGRTAVPGTHMLYLDWSHLVDIAVNNPTSFRIRNTALTARTGNIVLIW